MSLTDLQKRDEIDEVAKGKQVIGKLFSSEQERFLAEFYKGPIKFGMLRVMGPEFRVLRWKPRAACRFCENGDSVEKVVVIHFCQEVICDAEDPFDRFA